MSTTAHLHVVGIAQDGGHPQIGCFRPCCAPAWADPSLAHLVACVALVDPDSGARWLLDASPDIGKQLALLGPPREGRPALDGVLVTHAHLGHVVGLLQLGREALAGDAIPVWAMPDLRRLVETQIPFSLLIRDDHISLQPLGQGVDLGPFRVDPISVPHRAEISETVALKIRGPRRTALFLPDIDRWDLWDHDLADVLADVDVAFLDATFFDIDELPWRDPETVRHPRVRETMDLLGPLPATERAKVRFIHLNHTNPLLDPQSAASAEVTARGFAVAREGERYLL